MGTPCGVVAWMAVVVVAVGCGGGGQTPADATVVDAPAIDAAADAATDAATDAPTDAATDGPAPLCDPLSPPGLQGCSSGQKCTWITVQANPAIGARGCVPDGTVLADAACLQGPPGASTGYDNCAAGLICVSGTCHDICGFDGSANASCTVGSNCLRYAGLFANAGDDPVAGACNPTCDPLTQLQSNGTSCGSDRGCYLIIGQTGTIAACAQAGTLAHGVAIPSPVFANSCVPGAQPRPTFPGGAAECGGLCRPADVTSTTNQTSEGGVAPDSCQGRWGAQPPDGGGGESCRYWWARETTVAPSPYGNTVGWCFKHAAFAYDSDGNGTQDAPFPRCTTLTTGDVLPPFSAGQNDARYFWCVTLPSMFTRIGLPSPRRPAPEPRLDMLGGWR